MARHVAASIDGWGRLTAGLGLLALVGGASIESCAKTVKTQTATRQSSQPASCEDADAGCATGETGETGEVADEGARSANSAGPWLRGSASETGDGQSERDDDAGMSCATQTARAQLQPTYLFVLLDVSGSMGKGDKPWHDKHLKWDPVVEATAAFFEAPGSQGFSASLTFFPAAGGDDARCDPESYINPDVPLTALPSTRFRGAMDTIGMSDWRGGTPTRSALQGVLQQIEKARQTLRGRYVMVLVTDGYPQDCDDNRIDAVAELVAEHAAQIPTYVIGVANPPIDDAPDVTSNLTTVAEAGGTDHAFLIDTGDPGQTISAFSATIELIHRASVSCEVQIPAPPPGETFDKQKVSVTYQSGSEQTRLSYVAACEDSPAADDTLRWHYDDPKHPEAIELCPSACAALQGDTRAELNVAFECEQVIVIPD